MGQIRKQNHGIRKVCGCTRSRWAKCEHPWHFNFKLKGGPSYRFSLDVELGKPIESKTEAVTAAEEFRRQIRAGTFRRRGEEAPVTATAPAVVTLASFWKTYEERLGRPVSVNSRSCFGQISAFVLEGQPFGEKALAAITEDDVEVFLASLRGKGLAASSRNKYIQVIKALFRWAVRKGYLTRNPASDSAALRREKNAKRDRRLEPDEEARLLTHAGPHLQRLIIAALETGCRRGELLSLTWRDVNMDRREITIRAEKVKTRVGRVIPMSVRLKAALEMAKTDPAGKDFGPEAFVLGDMVGGQVLDIKRAWETCVLKAHGHTPTWTRDHALSTASRAAFRATNLTFHDLRHEAGSRLLEAGWALHNVAHMLGHANISQTSTYLNATKVGLQESMRRLDDRRCNPVAIDGSTDRAPLRNVEAGKTDQPTVN